MHVSEVPSNVQGAEKALEPLKTKVTLCPPPDASAFTVSAPPCAPCGAGDWMPVDGPPCGLSQAQAKRAAAMAARVVKENCRMVPPGNGRGRARSGSLQRRTGCPPTRA